MNSDDIKKIALQYLRECKLESDCIEYKKPISREIAS